MDRLEKFIRSEREAFDTKEPREQLWQRITSDLDNKKDGWGWLWKAAVVVLVPICGFLLWERNQPEALALVEDTEVHADPEFEETELYYTQLISEKQVLIENFIVEDPEIKESFKNDLASLDSMYMELKTEFIETSNVSVVDAMIYNLQLRMELLNQQLMILEKINSQYNNEENSSII